LGLASALGSLLPTSSAGRVGELSRGCSALTGHSARTFAMADSLAAATEEPSAHAVSLHTRALLL